ncbi:MAG TPA: patatin-like phospholipase family protein [Chloroflexota bacterium]|nr:patatin-like phospholipase family protein [Chloroflexota bacterium]
MQPKAATTTPDLPSRPGIGLVLGAGGIRGCSHPGVMAVLTDAGVRFDLVVGASVGALFGLGLAAGLSPHHIVDVVRRSQPSDIARFYAGRLRAGRSNPIARMMLEAGEGKTFADMAVPFAVTATDMHTGQPVMINTGPVLDAVQASIALPLIARPVRLGDRYYLDGGLFDTAPVRVARSLGAEKVIAVCLGYNYHAPPFFKRRPWLRHVLQRAGRQQRLPGPRLHDQIRFACRMIAASYDPPLPDEGDITIWPDLGTLSPNSWVGAQFCLDRGFEAARAIVESGALAALTPR